VSGQPGGPAAPSPSWDQAACTSLAQLAAPRAGSARRQRQGDNLGNADARHLPEGLGEERTRYEHAGTGLNTGFRVVDT
jgi:hypothetical protein